MLALDRSEKQSVDDLLAGKIDLLLSSPVMSALALRNGNAKAFAVTAKDRTRVVPDIPTTDEAGLSSFTFLGGTPFGHLGAHDEIIAKLNSAMVQALDDAEITENLPH